MNKIIIPLQIIELSKFLLFSLLIYFLNYSRSVELFQQYKATNLKICICTLGKEENKYINEFVEYYKNYGVDKIYLYDNNDIKGERFDKVIGKYIESDFVKLMDWRGIKGNETYYKIMDSCYQSFHDIYDWLIFYELDEFIYLKDYNNIKDFLTNKKFDKCDSIQLNWVHMSDNNKIFYENKSLIERFPKEGKNIKKDKKNKIRYVKTIVRGHLKNISVTDNHLISDQLNACNGFGKKSQLKGIKALNPDYKYYYIKHYYSKTVQEFIEKINRGDLLRGNSKETIEWAIEKFFYINKITSKKIKYIKKKLGSEYNLSKYVQKLKKSHN